MVIAKSQSRTNNGREYFVCPRARHPTTVFDGPCGAFGGWVDQVPTRQGSRFRWGVPSWLVTPNLDKVLELACTWNDPAQRFAQLDRPLLAELSAYILGSRAKAAEGLESRTARHALQRQRLRDELNYEHVEARVSYERRMDAVLQMQRREIAREEIDRLRDRP